MVNPTIGGGVTGKPSISTATRILDVTRVTENHSKEV